jgi:uncharacterized protein (TIRG00374 family)
MPLQSVISRFNYFNFIKLSISVICVYAIYRFIDLNYNSLFNVISNVNYIYLSLLTPLILGPILANLRWQVFLNIYDVEVKLITLIKISFKSFFLSLTLPSSLGYDVIRLMILKEKFNVSISKRAASIFSDRLLALLILSISSVFSSIIFLSEKGSNIFFALSFFLLSLLVLSIVLLRTRFFIYLTERTLVNWKLLKRFSLELITFLTFIKQENFNKLINFKTIILIVLFQFSSILCSVLIFYALDINIAMIFHFCLLPLIWVITMIPITFSGLGLREGVFIYFYNLVGVASEKALIASLLTFLIQIILTAIIGCFLLLIDKKRDFLG